MLSKGIKICIDDALYFSKSRRNLLSFEDKRSNGYHIETNNYTTKRTIEANVAVHQKCSNPIIFTLWHNRFGHLRAVMMLRIIENSNGHLLKNQKILLPSDYPCSPCSQDKLIIKPSPLKIAIESPSFL
jgi:hypothetical protein